MMRRNLWMIKHDCIIRCAPDGKSVACERNRRQLRKRFIRNRGPIIVGQRNQGAVFIANTKNIACHQLFAELLITTDTLPLIPETVECFSTRGMWMYEE